MHEVRCVTYEQVVELHASVMESTGSKPQPVLHDSPIRSALERAAWGPFDGDGDLAERAALLVRGIAAEHPFVDGNKRTALAVADAFLRLNGVALDAAEEELVDFVLHVATAEPDLGAVSSWIRDRMAKA